MEFMLGCNYWSSNAGAMMWRDFDIKVIEDDLKRLTAYGVRYMRVFPNWREFQPVMPVMRGGGEVDKYCLEGDKEPQNVYYLDEEMLTRFALFLDLCKKYEVKVIVGLITGYMSGRLFVPSALFGKNVITDPLALYFEQLYIKGFVSRFKNREEIFAWDLGNECNCMGPASKWQAHHWTATISNAIRAEDNTRPIVSGMHGLDIDGTWSIKNQGEYTDILTTHPYPYWCDNTRNDELTSYRTTLHATAQNKFYSEISGKPCFAEEIGSMGPMLSSNRAAAEFLRVNMWSIWANGGLGTLWWCANEQDELTEHPYSIAMAERELGMFDSNHQPKPVICEMKNFFDILSGLNVNLSQAETQAVCLLTEGQNQWAVGYMTYGLLRKAGLNPKFAFANDEIPKASLYILPSVNGDRVLEKKSFDALKQRVFDGADLYISMNNAIISGFEALTGLRVESSFEVATSGDFEFGSNNFSFSRARTFNFTSVNAEVLSYDQNDNPIISVANYGKGRVFYVNFPLENNLVDGYHSFDKNYHLIYKKLFENHIIDLPLTLRYENAVVTFHKNKNGVTAVIINHSDKVIDPQINLQNGFKISKVLYGEINKINPFDALIVKLKN